jgi:hypothetical protein
MDGWMDGWMDGRENRAPRGTEDARRILLVFFFFFFVVVARVEWATNGTTSLAI